MQAATPIRLILLAAWVLVLFGCSQPERPSRVVSIDPDEARAATLVTAGQFVAAAELYRQLAARTAAPEQRTAYLLAAAEAAQSGDDWDGVRATLNQLAGLPLQGDQALQWRLLQVEVLLQERLASDALGMLSGPPAADSDQALRIRYYRDLADAYRQTGNLLESANALQAIDAIPADSLQRLATQTEILRTLALLNELVLTNLQPSPPGVSGGWMQLALIVKKHGGDPEELTALVAEWRQRFPQHPAMPELIENYQLQLQRQMQQASRIAILLPQSGPFADVAAAIRDGIVISRFQLPADERPELRFYDASDPAGVWPLYSRAVAEGAELVIGPLQKEAVGQLLRAGELPVPVLALNQVPIETAPPTTMFMYALSPEDEARLAAERIWSDGHRRPIVLTPRGPWGERLAAAFEDRWRGLGGGGIAGVGRYDDSGHDYSETIIGLLQLDRSSARHRQMQQWLGRSLEFEPRRRDDVDAIFMAARPVQAQGIRPQLQFHRAGDLPVYATSHAWVGRLEPNQVEDMRGIMLADIPWLLTNSTGDVNTREEIVRYLPNSASSYARLYAMGMDALRLVPHLKRLQSSRYESLDGSTGNLYMDEVNQIHRQLVWVLLDEEPTILGYAPRLDLQGGATEEANLNPDSLNPVPPS
ncbi:MAG: penicillin-binding protein activator [Sedimenticolaceae bacterium]